MLAASATPTAVAMGATFVERHITLDRALWGSDQAASVEVGGFLRLIENIRDVEAALGDGVKRVYEGELASKKRLRRVNGSSGAPRPISPPSAPTNGRATSPSSVSG